MTNCIGEDQEPRCDESVQKIALRRTLNERSTPPETVRYTVEHLRLPPELHKNIDHHFYEAGHMMYIHEPSMVKLRKDVEAFYEKALKK